MASDITGNIPSSFIQALAAVYPPGLYPSHIDIFGKGGFVPLNDAVGASSEVEFINDRIIEQRRKVGMFVYLSDINEYYRCSSLTGENNWERLYFSGRYFHGATAPTADDIQQGEKWFDTIVGTEYTYLPIAEGSTHFSWVDIDSIGSVPDGSGISGINLYVDDTLVKSDTTSLKITGGENVSVVYTNGKYVINSQDNADEYVKVIGDTMTGTLTGTSSFMDTSMIVSNSLSYENQPIVKIQKINGSTDDYSGYYPGTTGFLNLPRLVLEHNPTNSWGWPSAIDFVARPIPESNISSITHRIGNLFSTGGRSRLVFWGAPAQNSTYGAGTTGISAGLSGEGLTTLGYFQYAVGASDSGFHALKAFRTSSDSFASNEFTTKEFVGSSIMADNLIINGDFSVWQRGEAFRVLHRIQHRNQTRKQIGLNYYNFSHNTNYLTPKFKVVRGDPRTVDSRKDFFQNLQFYTADRWKAGWGGMTTQNAAGTTSMFGESISLSDWGNVETGRGFYVYKGFNNDDDFNILKNSNNFLRISTSPPANATPYPSKSRYEQGPIDTNIDFNLRKDILPFGEKGTTHGDIARAFWPVSITGENSDFPDSLKTSINNGEKSPLRITDPEYVGQFTDPFMDCKPTPTLENDTYGYILTHIPEIKTRKLRFGSNENKKLKLSFFARGNLTGDYGVSLRNPYADATRSFVHKFTIETVDQWKKYEVGLTVDSNSLWKELNDRYYIYNSTSKYLGYSRTDLNLAFAIASGSDYQTSDFDQWLTGNYIAPDTQVNLMGATGQYMDIAEVRLYEEPELFDVYEPDFSDVGKNIYECKLYYESSWDAQSHGPNVPPGTTFWVTDDPQVTPGSALDINYRIHETQERKIPEMQEKVNRTIYFTDYYLWPYYYAGSVGKRYNRTFENSNLQNSYHTFTSNRSSGVYPGSYQDLNGTTIFSHYDHSSTYNSYLNNYVWDAGVTHTWERGTDQPANRETHYWPSPVYLYNYRQHETITRQNWMNPNSLMYVAEESEVRNYNFGSGAGGPTSGTFTVPGSKYSGWLSTREAIFDLGYAYGYRGWGSIGLVAGGVVGDTNEGTGNIFGFLNTAGNLYDAAKNNVEGQSSVVVFPPDQFYSGIFSLDLDF